MPHVISKEICESGVKPGSKPEVVLARYAVYCRYGAKSDHATPTQFARIINQRAENIKSELLRRVKEIEVSVISSTKTKKANKNSGLRIVRQTEDLTAPVVRVTRDPKEASGIFVQEELSDHIFDDINHVLASNDLLSKQSKNSHFVLGEQIYYRIYAERNYVHEPKTRAFALATAAACKFSSVAPMYYWLLQLSPLEISL
jgi:hypothetical protein